MANPHGIFLVKVFIFVIVVYLKIVNNVNGYICDFTLPNIYIATKLDPKCEY